MSAMRECDMCHVITAECYADEWAKFYSPYPPGSIDLFVSCAERVAAFIGSGGKPKSRDASRNSVIDRVITGIGGEA